MPQARDPDRQARRSLRRLRVVHCYTAPWEDSPAVTPHVLMLAALDLPSGVVFTAAVHLAAEL